MRQIISLILLFTILPYSPNCQTLDPYVTDTLHNVYVELANSTNLVSSPVDLDFHSDMMARPFELWILNQGTNATGGSTVIIFDADMPSHRYKYIKDGNAWHFMALASSMAFSNFGNWATSADILDANRLGGNYTGPSLWSSDTLIYGNVGNPSNPQFNGSHLDMVHESPYGKGIAFEQENVFWVYDGYNKMLKRYDFMYDHGPGQDYHGDAEVRIYPEMALQKHATLPSHLVIDAEKKYLYGCDTKAMKIFRFDITSGVYDKQIPVSGEPLAAHDAYKNAVFSDVVTTGLVAPVGIDVYGNRLVVSDNGSGQIILYDISDNYKEIGRFKPNYLPAPDILGIKVGPDGKLYFVDKINKKVFRVDNSMIYALGAEDKFKTQLSIFPNPANTGVLHIEGLHGGALLSVTDVIGNTVYSMQCSDSKAVITTSGLRPGMYFIRVESQNGILVQKLIIQ